MKRSEQNTPPKMATWKCASTNLIKGICKVALFVSAIIGLTAGAATGQTTIGFASGVGTPQSGIILSGTGINPATGQVFRHLWSADGANGLCRIDADIDSQLAHSINQATCVTTAQGVAFTAGSLAFDPATNNLYVMDTAANGLGVIRLHYHPDGDSGHGLIDTVQQEVLGGLLTAGRRGTVCGIGLNGPLSMTFGPDNNLYLGFKRSPNIMRVQSPNTEPYPCSSIESNVAVSNDGRTAFGLSWIGHDLCGLDSRLAILIHNADQCLTPQNGNISCFATVPSILIGAPTVLASDQVYPAVSGQNLYIGNTTTLTRFNTKTFLTTSTYGGMNFSFISALAVDATNPVNPVLFVGDDPSNGAVAGQGRWFEITNAPLAPGPPAVPIGVTATAGDGVATVSWVNGQNGQAVTSYTVRNSFASNGLTLPDAIVNALPGTAIVPTSATISGLTDGVSYQFEVQASNQLGSSAFSAASNTVTPLAPTAPSAPGAVSASAGNGFAIVAWTAPASTGGSAITSYTVTTLTGGVPVGLPTVVSADFTDTVITGLTDGTTYTFTVHATNAIGSSPESLPSNAVTPLAPPPPPPAPPDLSVAMTGPASVDFGTNATYTVTVVNNGPNTAAQVNLTDSFTNIGAFYVGSSATQGACAAAGANVLCNLGTMPAGASVVVNITLNLSAQGSNQVSVQALDAGGNLLSDPNPANNTFSVATGINGVKNTTDIQVTGSAQNGGPAAGQTDTYTWQIKNGQNQIANDVVFSTTLPSTLIFTSVSSNIGTCTSPAAGSAGGIITCSTGSIPVGQTLIVTINVVVPKAGTIPLQGTATFNGTDTNLPNNSFTVTIQAK